MCRGVPENKGSGAHPEKREDILRAARQSVNVGDLSGAEAALRHPGAQCGKVDRNISANGQLPLRPRSFVMSKL
jgi:hypothetical protein